MVNASYTIRLATEQDAAACPAIEKAGARMFRESPFPEIAEEPTPKPDRFIAAAKGRLLIVGCISEHETVGFARLEIDGADLLIAEFDVRPEHQGEGVGARMLDFAAMEGVTLGFRRLTLTTFRDVPWNMPYYLRRGFQEIPLEEGGAGLRREAAEMTGYGYGPELRAAMARPIGTPARA